MNTQLDRFQQIIYPSASLSTEDFPSDQIRHIQDLIHAVSVTSKTQPLLAPSRLVDLLSTAGPRLQTSEISEQFIDHVSEYVWLVAAKAAAQVSGLVMKTLLDQTLRLHNEADYWNDTLESMWYTGLYAVQTSPVRLWNWTRDTSSTRALSLSSSLVCRWAQFYEIAHQSIRGRQGYPIWIHLLSPIRSCRSEVQQKRDLVKAMEEIHASSLGLLMEGWHSFEMEDSIIPPNSDNQPDRKWYDAVYRTVVLIETILQQAMHQPNAFDFEKEVVATIEESGSSQIQFHGKPSIQQPLQLVERLVNILREQLPTHTTSVSTLIGRHGRPSTMVRYWVPAVAAVLSSSASVRFMVHRQDKIIQWIINLGATIIDFGGNWVVDPIRKLIGTIRHDENSEIAIMSKNSLMADRASLERMVIDFVRDRPDPIHGSSAVDTTALANSVKEGDLTPVLRAYERDLRSPFVGTVRGDLIRALLIQIQKTKVDVEIAISGIDALLKSQELVFGYVLWNSRKADRPD